MRSFYSTVEDRLRLPWIGGAKKISLDSTSSLILVPFFILLGCFSWLSCFISYIVLMPTVLYSIHRYIKAKATPKSNNLLDEESKYNKRYPRSHFYQAWLIRQFKVA